MIFYLIDMIKGRFDECSWNHFKGEGSSILFEFSAEVGKITIISGFQLKDNLSRICMPNGGKMDVNRHNLTVIVLVRGQAQKMGSSFVWSNFKWDIITR